LGEIFIDMAKEGATMQHDECFAILFLSMQYGAPEELSTNSRSPNRSIRIVEHPISTNHFNR
jgi:hypothetical protein